MADPDGILLVVGAYDNVEDAKADFEAIKMLHSEKFLGDYESALFSKEDGGKVKIHNTDATERGFGAKVGLVTGAVIGLLFPPSIIAGALAGAGLGAITGNLMKGMSRADVKELGEALDEGQYGIVVVGETTLEAGLDRMMQKAAKVAKREIDAQADEMKKAIDEAADA